MRAGLCIFVLAACGCNDPVYLAEKAPVTTTTTMMGGVGPGTALYVLPVRKPTADERKQLSTLQSQLKLPMAVPWAQARDFDVEIEYVLKNTDTQPVTAYLMLNGGNEFGDYNPGAYINPAADNEDQTPPPPLVASAPVDIMPGQSVTGTIREDQTQESAIDLEAITRYPDPAGVRNTPYIVIEHLSTVSSLGLAGVPKGDITPAHVRYAFVFASTGKGEMDYTVRVRDHNGKLGQPTDKDLYVSTAAMLAPPVTPPPAMAAGM
jgi:hypothetical protein